MKSLRKRRFECTPCPGRLTKLILLPFGLRATSSGSTPSLLVGSRDQRAQLCEVSGTSVSGPPPLWKPGSQRGRPQYRSTPATHPPGHPPRALSGERADRCPPSHGVSGKQGCPREDGGWRTSALATDHPSCPHFTLTSRTPWVSGFDLTAVVWELMHIPAVVEGSTPAWQPHPARSGQNHTEQVQR